MKSATTRLLTALATMALLLVLLAGHAPGTAGPCAEDDACWIPALYGNGQGHISPFSPIYSQEA